MFTQDNQYLDVYSVGMGYSSIKTALHLHMTNYTNVDGYWMNFKINAQVIGIWENTLQRTKGWYDTKENIVRCGNSCLTNLSNGD